MGNQSKLLVIDTDVGSDDAMAIIMCAAAEDNKEVKILGLTCCHGNTIISNVCLNTLKTLQTINRLDIPVYKGAEESLVITNERSENIHGGDGLGDFVFPNPPDVNKYLKKEHAVNFLTKIASERKGEITLLCLGPLTNVAMAVRMDPQFCQNLKEIVIMGGNVQGIGNITAAAEFNFYSDPEAAFIVIQNMKCPISIFPWETAFKYGRLPYKWRKETLGSLDTPQMKFMNQAENVLLSQELFGVWARCDPMAAAVTLYPKIAITKSRQYATVELNGQATRGALVVDHLNKLHQQSNVTIIEEVDLDEYKKILMNAFSHVFKER